MTANRKRRKSEIFRMILLLLCMAAGFALISVRTVPAAEPDSGWEDPLDATATLVIKDFPAQTDFYAAGISEEKLRKMGIDWTDDSENAIGRLAEAAALLDESMTEREKQLIRADDMVFRGLQFGKTYLITGNAVKTGEGEISPIPFLVHPTRDEKEAEAEVKYTVEKQDTVKKTDTKSKKTTGETTRKTGSVLKRTIREAVSTVTTAPVKTGDVDIQEVLLTILSAFIIGLAVIIRKKIK